jgi:hypothetical protein
MDVGPNKSGEEVNKRWLALSRFETAFEDLIPRCISAVVGCSDHKNVTCFSTVHAEPSYLHCKLLRCLLNSGVAKLFGSGHLGGYFNSKRAPYVFI